MNLKQLQFFVRVAELGSITHAAQVLHIAQPALSRHIQALEQSLGGALFERNDRGVALSTFGQHVLKRTLPMLQEFAEIRNDLVSSGRELWGQVRFGIPPSLAMPIIRLVIAPFKAKNPNVTVTLLEATTIDLRERIRAGSLDLAVVFDSDRSHSARTQTLASEPLVLISANDSGLRMRKRLQVASLSGRRLVTTSEPNVIRVVLEDAAAAAGIPLEIVADANTATAICELVSAGVGNGVLPYSAVRSAVKQGSLFAAPIVDTSLTWVAMTSQVKSPTAAAKALHAQLLAAKLALVTRAPP